MGKKSAHPKPSKSLKTFYLYAFGVFCFIVIALIIRGVVLFQQNVFDPSHHFNLAVIQQGAVKEVISFSPQIPALSVMKINDAKVSYASMGKDYGIPTDGYLNLADTMPFTSEVTALMGSAAVHAATLDTNLTIFDSIRLFLMSKNVATNNEVTTDITVHDQSNATTTKISQLLTDPDIASESISIQIVNATNITGMGQRLGRVLTNMGANVVDITSSDKVQEKTTIAYYGEQSYTLEHLHKLLHATPTKLDRQPIADIIITIGTDKSNTSTF